MRLSFSGLWLVRLGAVLLSLHCTVAVASESPGWLLLFDTSGDRLVATAVAATERFEPGRAASIEGARQIQLLDDAGHVLHAAPLAAQSAVAMHHAGTDARRLVARLPALAQATRIDVVDALGAVAWSRRIDAGFRNEARRTADVAAAELKQATSFPGGKSRANGVGKTGTDTIKAGTDAIARLAAVNERRRRDERAAAAAAFDQQPFAEQWRRLETLRATDRAQPRQDRPFVTVPDHGAARVESVRDRAAPIVSVQNHSAASIASVPNRGGTAPIVGVQNLGAPIVGVQNPDLQNPDRAASIMGVQNRAPIVGVQNLDLQNLDRATSIMGVQNRGPAATPEPDDGAKAGPATPAITPITYRGRLLGDDGLALGSVFDAQIEVDGSPRSFQVQADGRYTVDANTGTSVWIGVYPPPPYPQQRLVASVDANGNIADLRMARGWVVQGRILTTAGNGATGTFDLNAFDDGIHGQTHVGRASGNGGRYALAVPKGSSGTIWLHAYDLSSPVRYLSSRQTIGIVDGDRQVDVIVDPGIAVPIRPIAEGAMPNIGWRAYCFSNNENGFESTDAAATGMDAAALRVRPGALQDCYFRPDAPYLLATYERLRFEAGQVWLPALRRGHRVTLALGNDAGANYAGQGNINVDGTNTDSIGNTFTNWSAVVPNGSTLINFYSNDGLLPFAIGPRRFERDERVAVPLRRGATVSGQVALAEPVAWRGDAYGTLNAYRTSDGTLVQSTTLTQSGYFFIALPLDTYDFRAQFFEDPAFDVLHFAPAVRTRVAVAGDMTVDLTLPAPTRTVTIDVSWPGCDRFYSSEAVLRENGKILGQPILGTSSVSCSNGVRSVKSILRIAPGDYELRLEPEGTDGSPWRRLDTRDGDATLAFSITPNRIWRPKLVDAQHRPVPFSGGEVVDSLSRERRYLFQADPDGRLTIPVTDGGTLMLTPPAGGNLLPVRITFDGTFTAPDEIVFDALPAPVDTSGTVRTVLASERDDPIRVLFIGDGYVAERETFTDTNGNGVWDGYAWFDGDGDGVYHNNLYDQLDAHGSLPLFPDEGGDPSTQNEPFVDTNGDGVPNVDDAALFDANVQTYLRDLFGADYWSTRRGDFEVSAAFLASPQAGLSFLDRNGATVLARRTLFNMTYLPARGLMSLDRDKAMIAAEQLLPGYDVLVVLLNQPITRGRANATIGTLPTSIVANGGHRYAGYQPTPISHEAGHAIGWLGDEYTDFTVEGGVSDIAEPVEPNVSGRVARDDVEWKDLIAADGPVPSTYAHAGIGLFPGAYYYLGGAFRPSWNSIMRFGTAFDAVSRRALDARFARLFQTSSVPPSGNWYDRRRAGHGVDLQRFRRDPVAGDLYFVVFYTYAENGRPEWYQALGRLNGGVFVPIADANGKTLTRVRGATQGVPDAAASGDFTIDFTRNAACRTDDRANAPALAAMQWSVDGRAAIWCLEPAVARSAHAAPDYSGHWYAPSDPGWGMEITAIDDADGAPTVVAFLYYRDAAGQPRWASASSADFVSGQSLTVYEADNGYCRTCPAPATRTQAPIGRMTLTLAAPLREDPPSGANRVDIDITPPGGAAWRKTDVPITLLSEPLQ